MVCFPSCCDGVGLVSIGSKTGGQTVRSPASDARDVNLLNLKLDFSLGKPFASFSEWLAIGEDHRAHTPLHGGV